jgi:hypothetical protein
VPEEELVRELRKYREFVLSNEAALIGEVAHGGSTLNVFSGERVHLSMLKACALYLHQYIIDDPLIPLAAEDSQHGEVFRKAAKISPEGFDKEDLARKVRFLKALTPMVAANFVKLLPISRLFEPPKELPLLYSENGFSDVLTEALMKVFSTRVDVHSMKVSEGRLLIDGKNFPSRYIHVDFRGHEFGDSMWFSYMDAAVASMDEGTRTAQFRLTLPDTPPTPAQFAPWLQQSVNRAAINIHNRLLTELAIAERFGAIYSTRSELVSELLKVAVPSQNSIPVTTANVFLNMDLPCLTGIEIGQLMRLRTEEGEAFQNFRIQLEKQMRDVRLESDPDKARTKAENAVHELTEVQVQEVAAKLASVKEKAGWTAAMATTGFMAAVHTSGLSLLAVAAAAVTGVQAAVEYRKEVKRHPAFFMWKLKQEARPKN